MYIYIYIYIYKYVCNANNIYRIVFIVHLTTDECGCISTTVRNKFVLFDVRIVIRLFHLYIYIYTVLNRILIAPVMVEHFTKWMVLTKLGLLLLYIYVVVLYKKRIFKMWKK